MPFAFRNIAGNGNRGAADLLAQAIKLVPGKVFRTAVNVSCQFHGFLPNSQIPER
jgi:hypothetical protein